MALVAVAAAASALALSDPAHAISRKQADQIAMRVLKTTSKKNVILFREPTRLRANDTVTFATRNRVPVSKKGFRRVGRRAWLYWQDLVPYAGFEHRSEMLVIDDRTGRVLQRRTLRYYPIVNGRPPAYLRSPNAYRRKQYRAFERMTLDALSVSAADVEAVLQQLQSPASPMRHATASSRRPSAPPFEIPPSFPRDAFQHDCVLMLGELYDWQFERDFGAFAAFGKKVGLRAFYATREGVKPSTQKPRRDNPTTGRRGDVSEGTVRSLSQDIRHLRDTEKCRDILIFAAGHGASRAHSKEARVGLTGTVAATQAGGRVEQKGQLTSSTLKDVVKAFPDLTFKFKIGACFSGRFRTELATDGKLPPNVLVVETSSRADQESFSVFNVPWRAAAEKGLRDTAAKNPALAAQLEDAAFREQVLGILEAKLRETRKAVVPNTDQLFEFTHANIVGMSRYVERWSAGQPLVGGSRLAAMVDASVELSKDSNQAVLLGIETPASLPNPDARPPGAPPPSPPPSGDCEVGAVADPYDRTKVEVRVSCNKPQGGVRINTTSAGVGITQASLQGGGTCLPLSPVRWTCFLEDAVAAVIDLTADKPFPQGARMIVDVFSQERPINEYEVEVG